MIYILLVILHFLFDWVLQPRHVARRKGRDIEGLSAVMEHMLINILPFTIFFTCLLLYFNYEYGSILAIITLNGTSHFLIDMLLPKGKNERQMINWTAIDQILHLCILFGLITYL